MHVRSRHRRPARQGAAVLTSFALAASATALLGAPSSQAATRQVVTDFGFQATAYGTQVSSAQTGLSSGKSAYSLVTCTRVLNRSDSETLAALDLPAGDPMIQVDGVASSNRSYRDRGAGIEAAVTSLNTIARVELGSSDTPQLVLEALRTRSTAWATTGGRLRAANEISSGELQLLNLEETPVAGTPLGDLLDAVDEGIDEVLATLIANGEPIEIPGLGTVDVGFERLSEKAGFAVAGAFVLKVLLYGADGVEGGGDDSLVGIGHSRARINRDLPAGVMYGEGYGADAEAVDGLVGVGNLGEQPLLCEGTDGRVLQAPVAGLDFLSAGQLVASGVTGRASGQQYASGRATAWTEGEVASLEVGPLELRAVRGRANVAQNRRGEIVTRSIAGSSIGELVVDGESAGAITPANVADLPEIDVPGVVDVDFFVTTKSRRGLSTSAVVITFAEGTPGVSQLRLGNAVAGIKRR